MAKIAGYKNLIAWQKAMELVEAVYQVSSSFPPDERFGLVSQIRRAAVSVPCNIAEGYGRSGRPDYVRFLDMARGSANEVETQLLLAVRLGFVGDAQAAGAVDLVSEVQRILTGLAGSLEKAYKTTARTRDPKAGAPNDGP